MARTPMTVAAGFVAVAFVACGCSAPPAEVGSFDDGVWYIGPAQTADGFDNRLGVVAAIGGEFVGDFSLLVRGRLSWLPGESVDRTDVSAEVGFLSFGGGYVAREFTLGYGFHFLDNGDWGTGFTFGLGLYRLVSPDVRLELILRDYAYIGVGDEVTFENSVDVAFLIGFRL